MQLLQNTCMMEPRSCPSHRVSVPLDSRDEWYRKVCGARKRVPRLSWTASSLFQRLSQKELTCWQVTNETAEATGRVLGMELEMGRQDGTVRLRYDGWKESESGQGFLTSTPSSTRECSKLYPRHSPLRPSTFARPIWLCLAKVAASPLPSQSPLEGTLERNCRNRHTTK